MRSTCQSNLPDMKGKRMLRLGCGCCVAYDLRSAYATTLAIREMQNAKRGLYDVIDIDSDICCNANAIRLTDP